MRYSIEPRDGHRFSSFTKNIGKNIRNKYSEKLVDRSNWRFNWQ